MPFSTESTALQMLWFASCSRLRVWPAKPLITDWTPDGLLMLSCIRQMESDGICFGKRDRSDFWLLHRETRPGFLIGSPPCTMYSSLQALNKPRMGEEVWARKMAEAESLLGFACQVYAEQHRCGAYGVHEHPLGASSWQRKCVQDIMKMEGVTTVKLDMCQFGLTARDHQGTGPAMKPTMLMTNCPLGRRAHGQAMPEGASTRASLRRQSRGRREIHR